MYHIPDLGRFLKSILPELARRAAESGCALPLELGICVDDERWLIHIDGKHSRVEPEKLSRRHLTLTPVRPGPAADGPHGYRRPRPRRRASSPRPARPSTPPASSSRRSRSGAARSIARRPELSTAARVVGPVDSDRTRSSRRADRPFVSSAARRTGFTRRDRVDTGRCTS